MAQPLGKSPVRPALLAVFALLAACSTDPDPVCHMVTEAGRKRCELDCEAGSGQACAALGYYYTPEPNTKGRPSARARAYWVKGCQLDYQESCRMIGAIPDTQHPPSPAEN